MPMNKAPGNQGISSNKLVRPSIRTGAPAQGKGIGRVAQIGNMVGDHVTNQGSTGYRGDPMLTKPPAGAAQALGNAKTMDYGAKGQGRTVMSTGTQQMHGAVNPGERKPITGPDPTAAWWPSNNAARRSAVVKRGSGNE
jgi:hypothetical protein